MFSKFGRLDENPKSTPQFPGILFVQYIYSLYSLIIFSCPGGTKPVQCLSGSYSDAGEEGCTTCPKGFYCPEDALKAPKPCQLGEYTDKEGQTNCSVCNTGYFCNDTKTAPEKCEQGYYSEAKMSACALCPAGYR